MPTQPQPNDNGFDAESEKDWIRQADNQHVVPDDIRENKNTLDTNAVTRAEAPGPEPVTHKYRIEENMLPFGISPDGEGNHQQNAEHEIKASTLEKQRVDAILDEEEARRRDKHANKRG